MLSDAIGDLLAAAVAVALSPVPIIAVILMLDTPKARTNGPAFALGWVLGLTAVSVVVMLVAGSADTSEAASDTVDWAKLAVGVLFLVMAAKQWRGRPKRGEEPVMPKWMSTIDAFTPAKSFGLALLLSAANPKNLALTATAAATIAQAGLSAGDDTIAIAVFVVIGSLTTVGPALFYVFAPSKAAGPLASIKEFMSDHSAVIMMVVLLVLGAKLVGAALPGVTD